MKNLLVQALMNNGSKNNIFDADISAYSYKTGSPVMDYAIGYRVNVYDEDDTVKDSYISLGIAAGSQVCVIGKPSTGKTTWAVGVAAAITRGIDNAFTIHYDLEQCQSYTRIQQITGFKMSEIRDEKKYKLEQGFFSIGDIKSAIMQIYMEKTSNPKAYRYHTGKLNEFGEEIVLYVPTVIVIDSIPNLMTDINLNEKKDRAKVEEVSSQTDRMRVTGEISRFYSEIIPFQKEANIIVISINQIKAKSQIGVVPEPSEMLYLGQNEAMPGGKAPQFLANLFLKFVAIGSEKYTQEEDGFEGFGAKVWIIKSRTNSNGKTVHMIYDKFRGFDSLRTSFQFAKEQGLVSGNRNAYYFQNLEDGKEHKFGLRTMRDDFKNDRTLYRMLYDQIIPVLEAEMPVLSTEVTDIPDEEFDY